MFTGSHQGSEDLMAYVQTNSINCSNLGGGQLYQSEIKMSVPGFTAPLILGQEKASVSKTGM